jgi:hypothetical protein
MLRFGSGRGAAVPCSLMAAALLAAGCSTMPSDTVAYEPVPIGTTWAMSQTNAGSYGSGTGRVALRAGERTWQGERVLSTEGPAGAIISRASDGLRIGALAPDGRPAFMLSPPVGPVFPLVPGKTWTATSQMTLYPSGQVLPLQSEWKVHGFEQVTVPAGTFRTVRFSTVDRVNGTPWNEDTYWYSPETRLVVKSALRRASTHPAGAGTREGELLERPKSP